MNNFNNAVVSNFECKCSKSCDVFDFFTCGLLILNETLRTSPLCSDTLIIDRQTSGTGSVFHNEGKIKGMQLLVSSRDLCIWGRGFNPLSLYFI